MGFRASSRLCSAVLHSCARTVSPWVILLLVDVLTLGVANTWGSRDGVRLASPGAEVTVQRGSAGGGDAVAHERQRAVASGTAQSPATTIVDLPRLQITA